MVSLLLVSAVACVEEGSSGSPAGYRQKQRLQPRQRTRAARFEKLLTRAGAVPVGAEALAELGRDRDSPSTCVRDARRCVRESDRHGDGRVDRLVGRRGDSHSGRPAPDPATLSHPRGLRTPSTARGISGSGLHDVLAADAAGVQTLVWFSDGLGYTGGPSQFNEIFEVTVADRGSAGGAWSSLPAVLGAGFVSGHALASESVRRCCDGLGASSRGDASACTPPTGRPPAQDGRLRSW